MEEVFVLILAVAAIIFAAPYALAILLYTFPVFAFWLMLPVRIGPEPQLIIDLSSHPQLAKLRAERQAAKNQYDEVRYSDWGIRWSDNLGRFEERSIRGQQLNEELGNWRAEADRMSAEIRKTEGPETEAFAQWSMDLRTWNKERDRNAAKQVGWQLALLIFASVWIATELLGTIFPGLIKFFAFAWNPAPDFLHPGLALGALAGWGGSRLVPDFSPAEIVCQTSSGKDQRTLRCNASPGTGGGIGICCVAERGALR
jgi:hypothetical protein